ncbi:hypothetical protein [Thioalkalivibrio sp. XN279]|uniref:hypothetical protein n=1 Tax=Thioalkalivibrio sp. XN279 TaxID=2714953 RepID=UPI001409ABC4|nr:hypothetical protein [Thioalkalivibrio sp. XN279]NHA14113.1 hypothetical protein [Thioalkalivibrio sp. XN279]
MPVDLHKPPHLIVVHGAQRGRARQLRHDRAVSKLVNDALVASGISENYTVRQYVYEDRKDRHPTVRLGKLVSLAIARGRPLAGLALATAVDLVGDVLLSIADGSTAQQVRAGLKASILESHAAGHRVLVVAHSLGTLYALQAVNELVNESPQHFAGNDRRLWATQGLVTLGSPLGLDFRLFGLHVFPRFPLSTLPSDCERFPWHNFFSRHDPVVTGRVFGECMVCTEAESPVERRYRPHADAAGWLLNGHHVRTRTRWLTAHAAYWTAPAVGEQLVGMLWG